MNGCERMEVLISALLDGEAERSEQREAVDHLLACPACRDFYAEARALQARLDTLPAGALAGPARGGSRWLSSGRAWLQAAALLAMLALGLGLGNRLGARPAPAPALPREGGAITLALGSDGGEMNDREFLDLTLRLLRADRRYLRELAAILERVTPALEAGEAGPGDFELTGEGSPGDEPERAPRVIY